MAASLSSSGTLGVQQTKELKSFGERVVRLIGERNDVNASITEVMDEAREAGFDPKIIRKAVKLLMADESKLRSEQEMVDSYFEAMKGLPLFDAAREKAAA